MKVQNGYTACSHPSMMRPSRADQPAGVTRNGVLLISSGKTGIRIEKPIRSMKTVRKIGRTALRFFDSESSMSGIADTVTVGCDKSRIRIHGISLRAQTGHHLAGFGGTSAHWRSYPEIGWKRSKRVP